MVLGCILCDQPLVTRLQPGAQCRPNRRSFAKAPKPKPLTLGNQHPHPFLAYQPSVTRLRAPELNWNAGASAIGGGGMSTAGTGSPAPPPPQRNDFEVLAAKCGHMFHRVCLKTYVAARVNASIGNKRQCPFCDKYIALSQCVPIELLVPEDHLLLDQLSALLQQNDSIQQQVAHLRTVVKVEKGRELEAIQEEVKVKERELQLKRLQLGRIRSSRLFDEEEIQALQREHEEVEEENERLTAQNNQLIELIERTVKMRNEVQAKAEAAETGAGDGNANPNDNAGSHSAGEEVQTTTEEVEKLPESESPERSFESSSPPMMRLRPIPAPEPIRDVSQSQSQDPSPEIQKAVTLDLRSPAMAMRKQQEQQKNLALAAGSHPRDHHPRSTHNRKFHRVLRVVEPSDTKEEAHRAPTQITATVATPGSASAEPKLKSFRFGSNSGPMLAPPRPPAIVPDEQDDDDDSDAPGLISVYNADADVESSVSSGPDSDWESGESKPKMLNLKSKLAFPGFGRQSRQHSRSIKLVAKPNSHKLLA